MAGDDSRKLLLEIADCPELRLCREHPDPSHPCQAIVDLQADRPWAEHQRPEPWNGRLESAPLLFISSNPSIDRSEPYPTGSWDDGESIASFFERRFDDHIVDGTRPRKLDGRIAAKPVTYLNEVRRIASNLFDRTVAPGTDYAITEVVHCKSASRAGLERRGGQPGALARCPGRYLRRVVESSGARVMVAVGADALREMKGEVGLPEEFGLLARGGQPLVEAVIGDRDRLLVAVGGIGSPNSRDVLKTVVLSSPDLARVQAALRQRGR